VAAALASHPKLRACAVVPARGPELVAYVVPTGKPPSVAELRAYLADRLPAVMIPSAFVTLDRLPLSPNGKLDRPALPRPPARDEPRGAVRHQPPRDRLERQLASIWEEVLGVRPIGLNDSFFDLGGHSLLAVRLFSRIEKATGRKLPVRTLFEAPTLGGLAAILRSGSWQPASSSSLVALQTGGSRDPVFWVHAAGGHVVAFRHLAGHLGPDQPSFALEGANYPEGIEQDRIEEIAARYIRDILEVRPVGPYLLGGLSFGGLVAFEMARQLRAAGHAVPFLGLLDTHVPRYPMGTPRRDWVYWLRQRSDYHLGNLSALDLKGKLAYVGGRVRHQASRALLLTRRFLRRLGVWLLWGTRWEIGRAYWAAQRARMAYRPDPYDGPVTLFRAPNQPKGMTDPSLGWAELARGGLHIIEVGGTHVSMMSEPRLPALGAAVRAALPSPQRNDR
jgi:thioesterase domain-containing protein/acyl carrier protein